MASSARLAGYRQRLRVSPALRCNRTRRDADSQKLERRRRRAVRRDGQIGAARNGACVADAVKWLRALVSPDTVSGCAFRLPFDVIERAVMRILKNLSAVEGVLYDVTGR